jgi:phosphoglucomutase
MVCTRPVRWEYLLRRRRVGRCELPPPRWQRLDHRQGWSTTGTIGRKDPGRHYQQLANRFGTPYYIRQDAPASATQRHKLARLSADSVKDTQLAGEEIIAKLTHAPGNGAAIGGLKVVTEKGWFAARPSGTEDVYKIYAESLKGEAHLNTIVEQARALVSKALS